MHNIYDCVDSFRSLLDTEYQIILGRKGVARQLNIGFDKKDCFHLMGLQYLKDRPELSRDRGKVFDEIRERRISTEQIESSVFYKKIEDRINMLPFLEALIDSNDTIYKYTKKANIFSVIDAEYLMKNHLLNKNVYIFLSKNKEEKYFCKSFFSPSKKDYTRNQASWTLLYKKKIRLLTNEEDVLFDRLRKKN